MSGLWSYRGIACSSSASDVVPDVVRTALPLATLDTADAVSASYIPPQVHHGVEEYDSDDFEMEDDDNEQHPSASNSYQTWLNGISDRVDGASSSLMAPAFDVESVLLELKQYGGELHATLNVSSSNYVQLTSMERSATTSPGVVQTTSGGIFDSEQELMLKQMIETSEAAVHLAGSSFHVRNSRTVPPQPAVASTRKNSISIASPATPQLRSSSRTPKQTKTNTTINREDKPLSQESVRRSLKRDQLELRNEARAVLSQCSLNKQRAEDELERQRCLKAISNIQRSQQNQKILTAGVPVAKSSTLLVQKTAVVARSIAPPAVTTTATSHRSPSSDIQSRQRGGASSSSTPSLPSSSPLSQYGRPSSSSSVRVSSSANASVSSAATPYTATTATVSYRDPNVRLAASLQRRQQEMDALLPPRQQFAENSTGSSKEMPSDASNSSHRPIILDDRVARKQRVHEFTLRTTARAQQKEEEKLALIRASEQRVERHNQLRLLWFYAWLPWKKTMLVQSIVAKQASSFGERCLLQRTLRGWKDAARASKKLTFAVSCARAVALQRFLFWCWKRRVFLFWRSIVALRRAQERDAVRFRKRTVLVRWKVALSALLATRDCLNDDAVSNFTTLRMRQTKRRLFCRWKSGYDARCLARERAVFRSFLASVAKDVVL